MNLDKEIISQIWDGCSKQIVDGYVYIKMDDLVKLEIENILNNKSINQNEVANYLNSKGFKYEVSVDGKTKSWTKK
tara:strand:- start:552 stop:779 length:228 start_codon:yes stop_codon:yes gene_type:complete